MERLVPENVIQEWSGRVRCKLFEIGGSFSVFLFLGNIPTDATQWLMDPAFAGTFDVFANETPDECANCNEQRELVLRGFVHLNRSIVERLGQPSLEKDIVVPYLQQNLNWGLRKADGEVVEIAKLPSLEVTVKCTPLSLPVGSKYPIEGEPEYYHDITRGRPGGYHGN